MSTNKKYCIGAFLIAFIAYGTISFFRHRAEIDLYGYEAGHIVRNRTLIATRNSLGIYDIVNSISPALADEIATLITGMSYDDALQHEANIEILNLTTKDAHFREYQQSINRLNTLLQVWYEEPGERKTIDEKVRKARELFESYKQATINASLEYGRNLSNGKVEYAISRGIRMQLELAITDLEQTLSAVDGGRYSHDEFIKQFLGRWRCTRSSTGDKGIIMDVQPEQVLYYASNHSAPLAKDADIFIIRDGNKASFRFRKAAPGVEYMNASLSPDGSVMIVRSESMDMTWEYQKQ